jgi:hypothetical protein
VANGNTTVSRLGQLNAAGAAYDLFLKKFAGEVLKVFDETNVMMALHRVRTITSGKSAQFPAIGTATAKYHAPGENIADAGNSYLSQIKHNERVIGLDNPLLAATFIARIDEAMNHYDVRSEYAHQLGEALAVKLDKTLLQVAVLAARAAATISAPGGNQGGSAITDANMATSASTLIAKLFECAQKLDEKNVPATDRVCVLKPAQYYLLAQNTQLLDRDFGGANGVYAEGTVLKCAGIRLVKSNHVPSTNIAAADANIGQGLNTYHGDFSKTVAVVFNRQAIGTVKLMDLSFESEYKMELQGTLMVAKYAMGHGILEPACAIELATP